MAHDTTARRTARPSTTPDEIPEWIADVLREVPALAPVSAAAAAMQVSTRTLKRRIAAGFIRSVSHGPTGKGSTRVLIPRSEIARYLRSLEG